MIPLRRLAVILSLLAICQVSAEEKPLVTTRHSAGGAGFKIEPLLPPASNDAATGATFALVDGKRDPNGGSLDVLHDGKVPASDDDPAANFFLAGGTKSARLTVDLGRSIAVQSVATCSWHGGVRGPQHYQLYAADGTKEFNPAPAAGTDPAACGWQLLATVDTRPAGPGQHIVSISAPAPLGQFRHLLFDLKPSSDRDVFGQTFFSEIDIVDAAGPPLQRLQAPERILKAYPSPDHKYKFMVDATAAPDLAEWAEQKLIPVVQEWYPKIIALLPSDGYTAPVEVMLQFKDDMKGVPAYAAGNQVSLNAAWFRRELEREARGSVVHELVHVVQGYGRARLTNARPARPPGWIVEGIPDYIRWFLYEPQTRGADLTARNIERAKYDDSYRISANFLDWVHTAHPGKDLIRQLNTACREGKYSPDLWKEWTGQTLEELAPAWKKARTEQPPRQP